MSPDLKAAHPRLVLSCARPVADISYPDLAAWLDNLAGALGDRLLRLKGLVQVKTLKQPLLIESMRERADDVVLPDKRRKVARAPLAGQDGIGHAGAT